MPSNWRSPTRPQYDSLPPGQVGVPDLADLCSHRIVGRSPPGCSEIVVAPKSSGSLEAQGLPERCNSESGGRSCFEPNTQLTR